MKDAVTVYKQIITMNEDHEYAKQKLLELAKIRYINKNKGRELHVECRLSPDGRYIISGSWNETVRVLGCQYWWVIGAFVFGVSWFGSVLVVGCYDGDIILVFPFE